MEIQLLKLLLADKCLACMLQVKAAIFSSNLFEGEAFNNPCFIPRLLIQEVLKMSIDLSPAVMPQITLIGENFPHSLSLGHCA